jgi:hypothetical protein
VGGFIDKRKRLPSPLPKPSAHGFVYDATSRRIELEREHVRLRRNEKVNLPIFFSKPCAPEFGNDGTSRPESVDWALERH